jgi:hypothetical protein
MENPAKELYSPASGVGTNAAKRVIVALVADKETIQRKRERLAAETYECFWNICPELTVRWKRAMLTLPPSVLQDLAAEIEHLEAVTNWANQQLHAALAAGGEPPEDLLNRALASTENLSEAADTDDAVARRAVERLETLGRSRTASQEAAALKFLCQSARLGWLRAQPIPTADHPPLSRGCAPQRQDLAPCCRCRQADHL